MITNEQINLYNEAAITTLKTSKKKVKFLEASRQAAMETISKSEDGLHLPESARDVVRPILLLIPFVSFLAHMTYLTHFPGCHGTDELDVQQDPKAH